MGAGFLIDRRMLLTYAGGLILWFAADAWDSHSEAHASEDARYKQLQEEAVAQKMVGLRNETMLEMLLEANNLPVPPRPEPVEHPAPEQPTPESPDDE